MKLNSKTITMTLMGKITGINRLFNKYSVSSDNRKKYYNEKSDVKNYSHFLKTVYESEQSNRDLYNSPVRIKPYGLNFGLSKQEVVREKGRPNYVLVNTGLDNHEVIYYKKTDNGYRHCLQIHFVNNKMVYAMKEVIDNSANRNELYLNITRKLLNNYSVPLLDDLNEVDSLVCDDFNNKVVITMALAINIRYISGSKDFIDYINSKTEDTEISIIQDLFEQI